MALRVGIDLVSVDAIGEAVRDHGDRYLQRLYTEAELRDCRSDHGVALERLAVRFAAKEATLKVLRPSDQGISWKSMEVVKHPTGWVGISLSGSAARIAEAEGLGGFVLSVAHEENYATAVVVAEEDFRK